MVGILIGVVGYYLASTYSLAIVKTETVTQTTTQQITTTQTQLSVSTSTKIVPQTITQTSEVVSTSVVSETTTQTSFITSTSTSLVYPVPMNVTVYVAPSGQFMNYAIQAGSYSASGSIGSPQSFSVSPVFQNEVITVSITLSCPGSTGPTGSATLYVNGAVASRSNVACGGDTTGQISYVL